MPSDPYPNSYSDHPSTELTSHSSSPSLPHNMKHDSPPNWRRELIKSVAARFSSPTSYHKDRLNWSSNIAEPTYDEPKQAERQRHTQNRRWVICIFVVLLTYFALLQAPLLSALLFHAPTAHFLGVLKAHYTFRSRPTSIGDTRAHLPSALMAEENRHHLIEKGILKVNPKSHIHPIYELIRAGRDEWDGKVARQSLTLKQAVDEYRARYGRQPPNGFDQWWNYVTANDVLLPDEYNQINDDLLPFFGLSPKDLNERLQIAIQRPDTYTITVQDGSIRTSETYDPVVRPGAGGRRDGQVGLIEPIAKWLGNVTYVVGIHDMALVMVGWNQRKTLLEHAEKRTSGHAGYNASSSIAKSPSKGWSAACPPDSPYPDTSHYASNPSLLSLPSTSLTSKSFIASHSETFNVCEHPELAGLHGTFAWQTPEESPLTPVFTMSKTKLHADILTIPTEQYVTEEAFPDVPWDKKTEHRVMWRGTNTGSEYAAGTAWRSSHRTRLLSITNLNHSERAEVGGQGESLQLTMLPMPKSSNWKSMEKAVQKVDWAQANQHYMDVQFSEHPLQCNAEDGTCDQLAHEFNWAPYMPLDRAIQYRYLVDVDGNAWSARFERLLTFGSLVFKATITPEWWNDRIQPWVHYVPIQLDFSDLYDAVAFFQGDLNSEGGEPALAREIANAGKDWAATYWRKEDMTAYMFRLLLEWRRLLADDRESMDFVYEGQG